MMRCFYKLYCISARVKKYFLPNHTHFRAISIIRLYLTGHAVLFSISHTYYTRYLLGSAITPLETILTRPRKRTIKHEKKAT